MTYNTLVAPKGAAGSVANWVGYTKLDIETVVNEAQSLIYSMLRIREMRTEWIFGMAVGQSNIALPDRFLDPIGRLFDVTNCTDYGHSIETSIAKARAYEPLSGAFGNNPFSFTAGSSNITAHEVGHGLTQGSTITIAGSDISALNTTFPVISIVDADNFVLGGSAPSGSTINNVGGAACTYTANRLISGSPSRWTIWDEQVKFDTAFDTAAVCKLLYYRAPLPLSTGNPSNWLTNRYPVLMRKACQASAADFMKDDTEYKKCVEALSALIQSTAAESDLSYRGAEFGTDTP